MGCDGVWEKNNNEQAVEWVQEKLKGKSFKDADLKQITKEYLHYNIAPDVKSSEGVGCDNMTTILITFDKSKMPK